MWSGEPFSKPLVERQEHITDLRFFTFAPMQPTEAEGGAQFKPLRFLALRDFNGAIKTLFSGCRCCGCVLLLATRSRAAFATTISPPEFTFPTIQIRFLIALTCLL